jgi:hypothetical protein
MKCNNYVTASKLGANIFKIIFKNSVKHSWKKNDEVSEQQEIP